MITTTKLPPSREQLYNWRLRLERERNKKQEKIRQLSNDLELIEFQLECLTRPLPKGCPTT